MTASVHYSDDAVTLWHGDARQVSEFIPADSVDLIAGPGSRLLPPCRLDRLAEEAANRLRHLPVVAVALDVRSAMED
jgi:hypothetical protein